MRGGCPHVLSDWTPGVKVDEYGKAEEHYAKDMRNRLHEWMQDKHVRTDEPIRKKWDKLYDSNREYILAVDHALQGGVGFGLAAFACGRIPGPLQKGQKRVMVPADKLPPSVATAKGFKQRAVVADDEGNKQLEVSWCPERRVLFDVADCGAIG